MGGEGLCKYFSFFIGDLGSVFSFWPKIFRVRGIKKKKKTTTKQKELSKISDDIIKLKFTKKIYQFMEIGGGGGLANNFSFFIGRSWLSILILAKTLEDERHKKRKKKQPNKNPIFHYCVCCGVTCKEWWIKFTTLDISLYASLYGFKCIQKYIFIFIVHTSSIFFILCTDNFS